MVQFDLKPKSGKIRFNSLFFRQISGNFQAKIYVRFDLCPIDFVIAVKNSGLDKKVFQNMLKKFRSSEGKWYDWIERSFLPQEMKVSYVQLIKERMSRLSSEL